MSKFSAIEISQLVALHPKVNNSKLFGLFERVHYSPTGSRIESYRNYYSAADAETLIRLSEIPDEAIVQHLSQCSELPLSQQQDYRMDLCLSADHRFVAFQVFRKKDDDFEAASKLRFLEGELAQKFENILA